MCMLVFGREVDCQRNPMIMRSMCQVFEVSPNYGWPLRDSSPSGAICAGAWILATATLLFLSSSCTELCKRLRSGEPRLLIVFRFKTPLLVLRNISSEKSTRDESQVRVHAFIIFNKHSSRLKSRCIEHSDAFRHYKQYFTSLQVHGCATLSQLH
jgi:hypothetical protein